MCLSEAFTKVAKLALQKGHRDLNQLPGCFEFEIDQDWKISLNPHKQPTADSSGGEVPPFNMVVRHMSVPVGVIDPYGGTMMTGTESIFIAVLNKQLKRSKHEVSKTCQPGP